MNVAEKMRFFLKRHKSNGETRWNLTAKVGHKHIGFLADDQGDPGNLVKLLEYAQFRSGSDGSNPLSVEVTL